MEIFSYGSCLVFVLFVSGSGAIGDSNYADELLHEGNQNNGRLCDCGLIGEFNQNTPEHLEDIIDRKIKPLHKSLEETITAKLETISNNLNRKIDDLTDNLLELSTNIINKINSKIDSASKENEILESTAKINYRLVVLANDFQYNIISKLDAINGLENKQYRSIKEITETLLIEQTTNITRQINNKFELVLKDYRQLPVNSTEVNVKLAALDGKLQALGENISSQCHSSDSNDRSMIKSIEEIKQTLTSLDSFPKKEEHTRNMTKDGENASSAKNNTKQEDEIKQTTCGNNTSIFCSPCATLARGEREAEHSVDNGTQLEDSLDKFLIGKTGCKYRNLKHDGFANQVIHLRAGDPPDSFEWRGAFRAVSGAVSLRPSWQASMSPHNNNSYGIFFDIGEYSFMLEMSSWKVLERRHTPGILSADRYVPFYYRVRSGVLTFGVDCESYPEPIFTRGNITLVPDYNVLSNFLVVADSTPGKDVKYFYDCPSQ